jgi:uncharacterized protein (TIGR02996 family)
MPTAAELYDAILADPDNVDLRLAYADAVEDTDPEHAELIRLDIEREQLGRTARRLPPEQSIRRRQLSRAIGPRIAAAVAPMVDSWQLRRGFPELVELKAARFLADAKAIYRHAPVRHLILTDIAGHLDALAASPQLARIRSLDLGENWIGDEGLRTLLRSPYLGGLRYLSLFDGGIGPAGAEALAAADTVPNLQYVNFTGDKVDVVPRPSGQDALSGEVVDIEYPPFGRQLIEKYGPKPWLTYTSPDPDAERYWLPDYGDV